MAKQSGMLKRQQVETKVYIEIAERVTQQLMLDSLIVTLNEEFGFGYDRIKRTADALMERYSMYHEALDGGPEADYVQEKLDQQIKRIVNGKQELLPFKKRYPEIREITYGLRKR